MYKVWVANEQSGRVVKVLSEHGEYIDALRAQRAIDNKYIRFWSTIRPWADRRTHMKAVLALELE